MIQSSYFPRIIFQSLSLICLLSGSLLAQFTDDFSDGNIDGWSGNPEKFEILNESLHLNDLSETSPAYLSNPVATQGATEWEFFINMDFDPSNNNNGQIYLRSNIANLTEDLNGYYVKIGENGSEDGIDLYVQNGGSSEQIIDGTAGTSSTDPNFKVRVVVDEASNWEIFYDPDNSGNWISQGTVMDDTYNTGNFIGLLCKYTSSNSDAFYFDDFYVDPVYVDNESPEIIGVSTLDANSVQITFSESVALADAENTANYSIDGLGNPSMAMLEANSTSVVLFFDAPFPNNENLTLSVENINDLNSNVLNGSTNFSFAVLETKSIVINEIFADPTPVVGLPEAEFVELFNRTDFDIDLNGWTFSDPTGTATIEDTSIPANGYLIVCKSTEIELWQPFGLAVGVSNFPSLNNADDVLSLSDAFGTTIDQVEYSNKWYGDADKKEGGYTLELRDADYPCQGIASWIGSDDPSGGTPGKVNSILGVETDNSPPDLLNAIMSDLQTVLLTFSEDINSTGNINDFTITPSLGINSIEVTGGQISISLSETISENVVYSIQVTNISDCSDNPIGMFDTTEFAIGEIGETGDVVINEILFNPIKDGFDYVELYNRSDKIIDLSEWFIGHRNAQLDIGFIADSVQISETTYTLFPDSYVVLTEDPQWVIENYGDCIPLSLGNFIEIKLPSYIDDSGLVGIMRNNDQNNILDFMFYDQDMHFELLDNVESVSLERIDPEGNSLDPGNWHSASGSCNGTPSYQNSQFYGANPLGDATITLSPKSFSPNGDSNDDFTLIQYQFPEPGFSLNITIYDDNGRKIRRLARNEVLGQNGQYKWDGTDDNGEKAPIGIYIVHIEAFNLVGDVETFKEVCVLAGAVE